MQKLQPPMISLDELPEEGRNFSYDRASGELNAVLDEIIPGNEYSIDFFILATGGVYQISGSYKALMDLSCVLCASDIPFEISERFSELILVQKQETARKDKRKRAHSPTYDGPHCHEILSTQFNVGEYFRELIAMCEPARPTGNSACPSECKNYKNAVANGWIQPDATDSAKKQLHQPFQVLKKIKSD